MNLNFRLSVLTQIADRWPRIGKSAMIKCVFFLQTIKGIPLDYDFEIYTYGPYSSLVMSEVDFARQRGYLKVDGVIYPNAYGYEISCTEEGRNLLSNNPQINQYKDSIFEIIDCFKNKQATELELLSTILFVNRRYKEKDKESVCKTVQGIKPKFTLTEIQNGYDFMSQRRYL